MYFLDNKLLIQNFFSAYSTPKEGGILEKLKKLWEKIKFWLKVTIYMFLIYWFALLLQCSKPSGGKGVCIQPEETGEDKSFTINMKNISSGGSCTSSEIYKDHGQRVDWIDTGFITTGEPLVVYATGEYFPWGKNQTAKTFGYHTRAIATENGDTIETLETTEDYTECVLNTNIQYLSSDKEDTRLAYANQFNNYTKWNQNNRLQGNSSYLLNTNKQTGINNSFLKGETIQADCLINGNCNLGIKDENEQVGCVLKNGAGIYMKIGDVDYAYHIINHSIPLINKSCTEDASSSYCSYYYQKTNNTINTVRVPFGLPAVVYDYNVVDNDFIKDIRGQKQSKISQITKTNFTTDYEFSIIEEDYENKECNTSGYQKIGDICYKSITKKLNKVDIQNPYCPNIDTTDLNMPNELCPPQKNKRIYIKPADTCYDDNEGSVKLTFTSGAKNMKPKFNFNTYNNSGISVSFLHNILMKVLSPFWGSQDGEEDIKDVISLNYDHISNVLKICHKEGNDLYYSAYSNNYIIKLSKYNSGGMILSLPNSSGASKIIEMSYLLKGEKKSCVNAKIDKIKYKNIKISNIVIDFKDEKSTMLFKINHIEEGIFAQMRNAIMKTSVYHNIRIIFVVWFIFSFGMQFITRQRMISMKGMSMDWKRFFIIMWVTDPNNYTLIDEILWPSLFYGAESIATGIMDAISGIWGTSMTADSPLEFFDDIIYSLTSKEVWLKFGAIATTLGAFYMFFLLFPLYWAQVIPFVFSIIGPMITLIFTLFSVGQILMFMPVYGVMSMLGINKDMFTSQIKQLLNDFVHFGFALGFYGMLIGFVYHYFTEIINIKICWNDIFSFKLLFIWKKTWGDWQLDGSAVDKIKLIWGCIKNAFISMIVVFIWDMIKPHKYIPDFLADIFAKGKLGMDKALQYSENIGKATQSLIDAGNSLSEMKKKKNDRGNEEPPPNPNEEGEQNNNNQQTTQVGEGVKQEPPIDGGGGGEEPKPTSKVGEGVKQEPPIDGGGGGKEPKPTSKVGEGVKQEPPIDGGGGGKEPKPTSKVGDWVVQEPPIDGGGGGKEPKPTSKVGEGVKQEPPIDGGGGGKEPKPTSKVGDWVVQEPPIEIPKEEIEKQEETEVEEIEKKDIIETKENIEEPPVEELNKKQTPSKKEEPTKKTEEKKDEKEKQEEEEKEETEKLEEEEKEEENIKEQPIKTLHMELKRPITKGGQNITIIKRPNIPNYEIKKEENITPKDENPPQEDKGGGLIVENKIGLEDGLKKAGIKDGLPEAGVKDDLPDAGIKDGITGPQKGGTEKIKQEVKKHEQEIKKIEKKADNKQKTFKQIEKEYMNEYQKICAHRVRMRKVKDPEKLDKMKKKEAEMVKHWRQQKDIADAMKAAELAQRAKATQKKNSFNKRKKKW